MSSRDTDIMAGPTPELSHRYVALER